jgi:uncharacterized membrane protein
MFHEFTLTELGTAAIAMIIFGLVYNAVVAHLERKDGELWGYTSLFVALGTFATLLGTWYFIGTQDFLIVIGAFFCTGLPMIFGSALRYIQRETHQKLNSYQINQEALETAERILRNGYITETR